MATFPHLKFIQKTIGTPRLHGGGVKHPASLRNKSNRQEHSTFLTERTSNIKQRWVEMLSERKQQKLRLLHNIDFE